mmetsp:Transcript_23104/g.49066  ORF Transcript_23104/g.49066 Transcript_23104/m.49066 type:complete len:245 (-) Transcript_23104:186-920(-)
MAAASATGPVAVQVRGHGVPVPPVVLEGRLLGLARGQPPGEGLAARRVRLAHCGAGVRGDVVVGGDADAVPGLQGLLALLEEEVGVLRELRDVLGPLADARARVTARLRVLVAEVEELAKPRLEAADADGVDAVVVPAQQEELDHDQRLVALAPLGPALVQARVQHVEDLVEDLRAVARGLGQLIQLRPRGAPRLVARRLLALGRPRALIHRALLQVLVELLRPAAQHLHRASTRHLAWLLATN